MDWLASLADDKRAGIVHGVEAQHVIALPLPYSGIPLWSSQVVNQAHARLRKIARHRHHIAGIGNLHPQSFDLIAPCSHRVVARNRRQGC